MKIRPVFVLAVLGWSLTEGRFLSKCELRDQLKSAIGNLTMDARPVGLTVDDLVAKLVCHAEQGSGLDISATKELIRKEEDDDGEQAEDHPNRSEEDDDDSEEHEEQTEDKSPVEDDDDGEEHEGQAIQPPIRDCRHAKRPFQPQPAPPAQTAQSCTLYGVFQLSSCQVCNDSVTPSDDVCGIPCSNLLDDDIHDDLSCLLKILPSLGDQVEEQCWEQLGRAVEQILEEECEDTQASVYFAECT